MLAKYIPDDVDFLLDLTEQKPSKAPMATISGYVEGRRILPPDTPFPGFWKNDRTPYMIEIMDNMSPYSSIQHTAAMMGAQLGKTAGSIENTIAYYMDECPAPLMMISATDDLLKEWAELRLEPLIDSCGYREKITANVNSAKSRRSGDKAQMKEFIGGFLAMASAQSPGKLRSKSIRVMVRDEIDGAPAHLRTGEGSWIKVSEARLNAWGARKKLLDVSTPTTWENSEINKIYESGDRRKFYVPCPHCETKQVLEFGTDKTPHGLKPVKVDGVLVDAVYICKECGTEIKNHQKTYMLTNGDWRPTAKSSKPTLRTYHLSSLYSPVGMLSWFELYQKYIEAQESPDGMRSFVNLYLGLPFKELGSRPKIDKVIELRGGYKSGQVPDGVLYLTAGIDVQRGSERDALNPARLELEVLGIGAGYRTYSILYKRIEGGIRDPYAGAWKKLADWAAEGGLTFRDKRGRPMTVSLVLVDSGDGVTHDVVHRFAEGWVNTYSSKGFQTLRKRKGEKDDEGDTAGPQNFKRYRLIKTPGDHLLYEISTNYYKTHTYNNLKIARREIGEQAPGFCEFPVDYDEKYFKMLTAEEKRRDGSFHCPSGRRNEALDTRVMALCAGDIYLDSKVMDMKAAAKAQGADAATLREINHRYVLGLLTEKRK